MCYHRIIRSRCKVCKGGSICEHEKVRAKCRQCKDKKRELAGQVAASIRPTKRQRVEAVVLS